jgi:valyl-tRNA synthetase
MSELAPRYDNTNEDGIYELWERSGYFNPDNLVKDGVVGANAPVFSIVLPPPNVTGTLHMGHAEMLAIEDVMVRYHRMRHDRTLWVPGTDHAAIATQSKVEKLLEKEEGKRKGDLGREEFLKRVNKFASESHDTITTQVRKMGSSVDWSREAFTLDEPRTLAVRTAFKKMYEAGLIYRGYKVVNWDPKGQTVISDDEIVYEERKAKLYTFKYSKDFPISISTTRPETKFGDTAVAVHPSDARYKEFVGKDYDAVFCGVPIHIKIVADETVEKEFGTGALGVTPAHSMIDWDIAKRHDLPLKQVINEYAKMAVGEENILGKKTAEAREVVVEWLKAEGLLEKEEEIAQNVSTAERTGAIIEPLPKLQWFIDVNKKFSLERSNIKDVPAGSETTLKEIMQKTVSTGQINIIPERFNSIYFHWIDNLRDWCISRQIWYGHRIPVWYKGDEIFVGVEAPEGEGWTQDSDTLDTWFSSGLWTFSTLGWPNETEDLKLYHPTNVLETAPDILFFWVARMVLMTGFLLGEAPFKTVYLHSVVLNKEGKKMSKSSGHAIDPLDMIKEYGADATRLSLIIGSAPGGFIRLSEDKVRGYRNFSTKIWNVARFVLMNRKPEFANENSAPSEEDATYLKEFKDTYAEVTAHIEKYEFHLAGELAYHYFWHTFADKVIEAAKGRIQGTDISAAASAQKTVETILIGSLTMLHPFMPFVTETIYQQMLHENILPKDSPKLLMIRKWDA